MIFHLSFRLLLMNTVIYCQLPGLKFLLYSNRYFTIAGSLKSTLSSPVSNFRIIFQSVSVSSKLSMSRFSVMRNVCTDLGIATIPSPGMCLVPVVPRPLDAFRNPLSVSSFWPAGKTRVSPTAGRRI